MTVIEIASGEYGSDFVEKMTEHIDNGRVVDWKPFNNLKDRYERKYDFSSDFKNIFESKEEINPKSFKMKCSNFEQYKILFRRASHEIYRNKSYLAIRISMHIFLGFVIGGLFYQMGNDATKTIFNFGFCFTVIIAFM